MKRLFIINLIIAAGLAVSGFSAALTPENNNYKQNGTIQEGDTLNTGLILKVSPFWLNIIPPSSGVQFYQDGIVFLSDTKSESRMLESHTSFGKIESYYTSLEDSMARSQTLFSDSSPWEVPSEAMTFNNDYSLMYYTKLPSGRESEKIYQAKYQVSKNGKHDWVSDSKPLNFCSDKSVYTHPALSSDGEKMVFASNRKESIGGMDLYISYKEADNWSEPINLGNLINTSGNEISPFLDKNNNLYFSSDGIKGFGGYDIYMCRYNGRGWDKPLNLTRLVNSSEDELAFTMNRNDGKTAFFSTKSTWGAKQVKLFRITFRNALSVNRFTDISNAFRYIAMEGFVPEPEIKQVAEKPKEQPVIKQTEPVKEIIPPPVTTTQEEQKLASALTEKKQEVKEVPSVELNEEPAPVVSDAIVYRVQFLSLSKPRGNYEIRLGGNNYNVYEYFYNGVYRSCVGEFASPAGAQVLQGLLKKEGFPDAFVVAFQNNERITGSIPVSSGLASVNRPEPAAEKPKPVTELPAAQTESSGNTIVFRVQFATNANPSGLNEVTIEGKTYKTFEYLYYGAYRLCAGEFSDKSSAQALQTIMRRGQYKDAFVVVFKNNIRVTDPELLK